MTGLPKGYVIPRLRAGDQTASVVARDGQDRAAGAAAGCDSRQLLFDQFASIYKARCKYCRDFHDVKSYCFRLRTFKSMPRSGNRSRSRSRSRSRARSWTRSSSEVSDSGSDEGSDSGDSVPQEVVEDGIVSDKHGPPVDLSKLDKFYSSRKRIDAPEEKLVLQAPTVQMYFRELLGHGKLDKDSAKKLRQKYYMGDKGYRALAPPTLSNTKLHMVQTHEAGGIYNRFLGIHIHHRDSLKLFLRGYELLGGCGDVFAEFEPVHPYVEDALAENFELQTLDSVSQEVSETAVEQLLPVRSDGSIDLDDLRRLARNNIALTKLVEKQGSAYLNVVEKLQKATDVAVTGVSVQGDYREALWSPRGGVIPYLHPLMACLVGGKRTPSSQIKQLC